MTFRIRLQPEAKSDLREAARWYEGQRAGLGKEFMRHFRRTLLHRFPYGIIFAVVGDTVQVIACLHAKRDPQTWVRRT